MKVEELLRKLKYVKVFTVIELSGWLSCSIPTARRRLRAWDAHTSYNCNGRYYALADVPEFDSNGLWRCRGAFFSRHGNLKRTVSQLVAASPAGLTPAELSETLGLEARSFLSHFRDDLALFRERRGRSYVWFAGDDATRQRQQRARQAATSDSAGLSDAEAVLLLVELLRDPHKSFVELAGALRSKVPRICPALIEEFLRSRQLLEKGGALDLCSH